MFWWEVKFAGQTTVHKTTRVRLLKAWLALTKYRNLYYRNLYYQTGMSDLDMERRY